MCVYYSAKTRALLFAFFLFPSYLLAFACCKLLSFDLYGSFRAARDGAHPPSAQRVLGTIRKKEREATSRSSYREPTAVLDADVEKRPAKVHASQCN